MAVPYVSGYYERVLGPIVTVRTRVTNWLSAMIPDVSHDVALLGKTMKASRALKSLLATLIFVVLSASCAAPVVVRVPHLAVRI